MALDIINKILLIVFILASLNVIRHLLLIIQVWVRANEETIKYKLTPKSLLFLGLSLSFIISSIIGGIFL
jgi:hypothetical protein